LFLKLWEKNKKIILYLNSRKKLQKLQKDVRIAKKICDFCDFLRLVFYGGAWFFLPGYD